MLYDTPLEDILFLDIETVPEVYAYEDLEPHLQELFAQKTAYRRKEDQSPGDFYEQAGIWAEFGKVITVGFGAYSPTEQKWVISSVSDADERRLLEKTARILREFDQKVRERDARDSSRERRAYLCAHNGKEFDFPFLARRMLIRQVKLPDILKVQGKKPWETPFCDTLQLWRFGDYKHYVSLELLAKILGLETPKNDISGKDVARVFYEENDHARIDRYCRQDVKTLIQVFLRMREEALPGPEEWAFR